MAHWQPDTTGTGPPSYSSYPDHLDPETGDEWLTDYYEDHYGDPTDGMTEEELQEALRMARDEGHMGMGMDPYSMWEILEHCIEPTVTSGMQHVGKLLFWCFVFRFTTQLAQVPPLLSHLASVVCGLVALVHFFYFNVAYIAVLSLVAYVALRLSHSWMRGYRGSVVTAACLTFNTVCELLVAETTDWHQIRGAQMILTMKAISLGFDVDDACQESEDEKQKRQKEEEEKEAASPAPPPSNRGARRRRWQQQQKDEKSQDPPGPDRPDGDSSSALLTSPPSLAAFLGYMFCPGTSVFGPWIKYADYHSALAKPVWNLTWFVKILFSLVWAFLFLTISTCWNPWMIPDGVWHWWRAYRDAMSFRASHYFISYVSEACAAAAGLGGTLDREGDWKGVQVAQPHDIEVPRSLREVTKAWNKPMSQWLKTYCFKKVLPCGALVAVLTTYLASVMLHGLNFQLGAVLFSLGAFAYVEHELRRKLSVIFDASVGTSRSTGGFRHKEWEAPVVLFNVGCGVLVAFYLAYLGVMFNQDQTMEEGYSWRHTIAKWQELGFAAHIVVGLQLVLMKLI